MNASQVGPYTLGAPLGEGGMGVVYRATDAAGREVALKLIRASLTSEHALARFELEASVRIEHDNVVRVVGSGVSPEGPYIAFELLEGETLAERLARGTLSLEQTCDVGVQACRGLSAAHAAGIVHRDLKPSNLFLCADGTVKLLDFGVARVEALATRLTKSGQVVGTLAYLSPEQAERHADVDHRTDLWSLGVVLYECLAGRPPFSEDTPLAMLVAVMLGEPTPLCRVASGVGPRLEAAIMRALSKRVAYRFRDAEELLRALLEARDEDARPAVVVPPTLRPDEQRAVVLLYAAGVHDHALVEAAVRDRGGASVFLPEGRVLGLFGGEDPRGAEDPRGGEVARAAAAAVRARAGAAQVAVSLGRAVGSRDGITGTAMDAAEAALATPMAGVAISADAAKELRSLSHLLTTHRDGTLELAADESALDALGGEPEPATFIGREVELARLAGVAEVVADDGAAQLAWIVGPSGIGKSRLCLEATARLNRALPEALHLVTRVDALGAARSLSLFGALLRSTAQGLSADPSAGPAALASLAFDEGSRDHARLTTAFGLFLSVFTPSDAAAQPSAPTEIQLIDDRLRVALVDWVLGAARRRPIVLVVEDAHRADARSIELLLEVVDRAYDLPLLVFATARSELAEAQPEAFTGGSVTRVDLRGLRRAHSFLLAEHTAGRPLPPALLERVAERTDGNPFFIEQIARALSDATSLPEDMPIPLSVEAALQSRLDALTPRERELCKIASVFGRPFQLAELAAVARTTAEGASALDARAMVDEKRTARTTQALRARGLWARREGERLDFVSHLLRDVAHRLLVDERRRVIHARAAEVLEAEPRADAEEIAGHLEAAGRAEDAAERYARAAVEAARRGDAETILRTADAAHRLSPERAERFDLRMARAEALRFRGSREAQREALEAALRDAPDPASSARVLSELCVCLTRLGRSELAASIGERAVEAARDANDPVTLTLALGRTFLARLSAGDLAEARARLASVEASTEHLSAEPPSTKQASTQQPSTPRASNEPCEGEQPSAVWALIHEWRGQLAAAEGRLDARMSAFARAAELHRDAGDLRRAAGAETNLADVQNRFGAYASAERSLNEALDACKRVGHRAMEGYARLNLAYSITQQCGVSEGPDRCAEALAHLDAVRAMATRDGELRLLLLVGIYEAKARLIAGDPERALTAASEALREAEARGFGALSIAAGAQVGAALLAAKRPVDALRATSLAMERLSLLGGVEEDELEITLAHLRAAQANGDEALATRTRERAAERLAALAAQIADEPLRARFLSDVAAHREIVADR